MFNSYLKIAFRNLLKNKSQTIINIGGLTLGTVCALVIFLIIQFDLSFDSWHKDSDRIYRVVSFENEFGNEDYNRGGPYAMAEAIRNNLSGIEAVTLVDDNTSNNLSIAIIDEQGNKLRFNDEFTAFVDQDYFEIFTYQWQAGSPKEALINPNSAVITSSFAEKIFGSTNVIGKEFEITEDAGFELTITGVVHDLPETTDFPFNLLISNNSKDIQGALRGNENWGSNSSGWQTYVKLAKGISQETVNAQFDPLITTYQNEERAKVKDFYLQPLADIHFNSDFGTYQDRVIEKRTLVALGIIGLFLLITACINFINLNTAIAVGRSKEVGLRKTLGGTKRQLIIHFLGETACIVLLSIALGIGITEILLKGIKPLLGFTPELSFANNLPLGLFILSLFVGISILAGWYPAQYLSGFNPVEAIRNKINSNYGQGITLRRGLTVLQLSITQILIITTIIIASQIKFFQEKDLGLVKDAIIEIDIVPVDKTTLDTFKNMLLNQSSILNVAFSNTGTSSGNVWSGNYVLIDDSVRKENDVQGKFIDDRFIDTYGLQLVAGDALALTDTVTAYLANETFARQTGYGNNYEGLIGKTVNFWGTEAPIVGILKDFNTQSLHDEVAPVLLSSSFNYYVAAVKINMQQSEQAIESIKTAFNTAFPDYLFEFEFLDEKINQMYEGEERTANIMNAFTVIAIIIGSLGLFGLVSYMATTRTKEIGVRKVLGATIWDILSIFGKELAILTGISFLVAAPLSYFFMRNWLADFAYRIELGFEIFALALLGTIFIAALTVGYKSITSATANPVESLKSE
jgi:ABC-type antimicrobial peptide transport system permease subunit